MDDCVYHIEWDVHENSLYMMLNQTLRLADRRKLRPWFKYLKEIYSVRTCTQ